MHHTSSKPLSTLTLLLCCHTTTANISSQTFALTQQAEAQRRGAARSKIRASIAALARAKECVLNGSFDMVGQQHGVNDAARVCTGGLTSKREADEEG